MLVVRDLEKSYGDHVALRGVSFDVREGEVVGFLGPNGAGKSTTMRIVTGFVPAGRGTVLIDGLDVMRHPLEARRRIGYLPESTPLYGDMRVREYLEYRARIKGVARRDLAKRVDYVIDRTSLRDRTRQLIETLSKGYRQRVGIADAMVGSPKLLVLDEPTIGLDPNQIREVRGLIRELGETHTLLLSTHILPEVEVACDRVIVIARGRTVADDTVAGLLRRHQRPAIRVTLEPGPGSAAVGAALRGLPGAREALPVAAEPGVQGDPWRVELVAGSDPLQAQRAAFDLARQRGWRLQELGPERVTLEQIFHQLTEGEYAPAAPAAGAGEVASKEEEAA